MKTTYFVSGLLIGGILVFLFINLKNEQKSSEAPKQAITEDAWKWPDSLDALVAAKEFHKLVFQTPEFRILEVTVGPGQLDPIHTHKGKSIVWVVNNSPLLYNTFGLEELNIGSWEKPEPPHSVENIGKELFKLYRLEFNPKTN